MTTSFIDGRALVEYSTIITERRREGLDGDFGYYGASAYIQPSFPVEFSVNVDNRPLRIEIPWETVESLLGTKVQEEQLVRDYLSHNRDKIMIARSTARHGNTFNTWERLCGT